uniref:Uncharacterized protein n=1 Tax=Arundo donax TaxID=35708 RepID=A0A0A8YZ53_ARUDO
MASHIVARRKGCGGSDREEAARTRRGSPRRLPVGAGGAVGSGARPICAEEGAVRAEETR